MNRTAPTTLGSFGIAILRIAVGAVFILHGYQKLFIWHPSGVADAFGKMGIPAPAASAWLATLGEFGGGILLLLGLFTRVGALLIAATMAVAFAFVHGSKGFFLPAGYEYVLVLFAASVALMLTGGGALAADGLLCGCCKPAAKEG